MLIRYTIIMIFQANTNLPRTQAQANICQVLSALALISIFAVIFNFGVLVYKPSS